MTLDDRPEDRGRKCPPPPAPTEYAYKKPPEPPKPRCVADEPGYMSEIDRKLGKYMAGFSLLGFIMLMANLYEQHRLTEIKIDPKRTDHAVQAGIRECERTLPRTQTCELSQLSFKVVEKKG